jgi:hypothetical protein
MVLKLSLAFIGATLAVAAAVAGIVLVVLGSSRRKPRWIAGGVAFGLIGFGAMIAAIAWAIQMDSAVRP